MESQKVFKKNYIEELQGNITAERYSGSQFEYDPTALRNLPYIMKPEGLLERMSPNPRDDFKAAVALYEAYSGISTLFATMDDLWVTLTHTDLFPYIQQRWAFKSGGNYEHHILKHWFGIDNTKRVCNSLKGLWWSIYETIDETRENKYELSEILFKSTTLREMSVMQIKAAAIGILEFFVEYPDLQKSIHTNAGVCRKLFDIIGGSKNLSILPKEYFKSILEVNISMFVSKSVKKQENNPPEKL